MSDVDGSSFGPEDARRMVVVSAALVVTIAALLALEQVDTVRHAVLEADRAVNRMVAAREGTVWLAVSRALSVAGGVFVTTPVRVIVGVVLAVSRRWWHLGAWLLSIVLMEVSVTAMKATFDRPRPSGALEATRSAAFPSGHAGATAVTVLTLLLLFARPGRRRWAWWWVAGGALMVLMSSSRVYLRVHWLSDVLMGLLVGAAAALLAVASLALLAEWRERPRGARLRG